MKNVIPFEVFERYGGASGSRAIMYHGTDADNIDNILKDGLVPGKKPTFGDSKFSDAQSFKPSTRTVGGIYLTHNLGTAMSAAGNALRANDKTYQNGSRAIIICDVQTRSLKVDEDWLPGEMHVVVRPYEPVRPIMDREVGTVYVWFVMKNPEVEAWRKAYVEYHQKMIWYEMEKTGVEPHPNLKKRVEDVLAEGFDAAITRLAAHYGSESIRLGKNEAGVPNTDIHVPTVAEGEKMYNAFMGKMTSTLKSMAKVTDGSRPSFGANSNGRYEGSIGFEGSNKIMTVLEFPPDTDRKDGEPREIIIHYGRVPQDILDQWKMRWGAPVKWIDKTKGSRHPVVSESRLFEKQSDGGDCFEASAKLVTWFTKPKEGTWLLVHGYVTGTAGAVAGKQYSHAWAECDGEVFDHSNGRKIRMPKEQYYEIGKIDPDECVYYTEAQTRRNLVDEGTYGPWDLEETPFERQYRGGW